MVKHGVKYVALLRRLLAPAAAPVQPEPASSGSVPGGVIRTGRVLSQGCGR